MKLTAVALGLVMLAACGDDDDQDAAGSLPVSSPQTTVPATQVQPTVPATSPPATTAEPTTAPATAPTTQAPSPATTAPDATAPASTAPAAGSDPTTATAVVYATSGSDFPWLPLGWWDGTGWGSVEWPSTDVALPSPTIDTVSVASLELGDPVRDVTDYQTGDYACIDDTGLMTIVLDSGLSDGSDWYGPRAMAVTADWDIQPRPVMQVGLDVPEYQALGESLVPTDQPVDPSLGDVVQVVRADLDGDGIEEVFVDFELVTEPSFGAAGDFSLLVARYPKPDGTVIDDVLAVHVVPTPMEFPQPNNARVLAIADLNGDGTMEVAVSNTYWEGSSAEVYEFANGKLHPVMQAGCGV